MPCRAVPGGGGGDSPDIGGQTGGPFGAGAVEVLTADHRGPYRSFRGVVIQGQLRQLLVAGQPVPFAGQRGDDLGGGRVQQALCRVGGLQYAMRIDVGERPLPACTAS
jgi:hypothetical protein